MFLRGKGKKTAGKGVSTAVFRRGKEVSRPGKEADDERLNRSLIRKAEKRARGVYLW